MSAAEEIWRASEEAARALDYEAQVREADAMLELTRQPDPRTTTTQALGMPPRETPLTPYRQARTRSCPGCGYPARYVGPASFRVPRGRGRTSGTASSSTRAAAAVPRASRRPRRRTRRTRSGPSSPSRWD